MTREAVLREAERTVGGYHDMVVFSLLEREWPPSMTGGPFGAAVFDLFGTLVPSTTWRSSTTVEAAARSLGADPGAFRTEFDRTAPARQSGGFADLRLNVRAICDTLGIAADDAAIDRALARRDAMYDRGSTRATAPSRRSPSCRRAATRSRSSACARPTSPSGGVGSRSRRWWT